MCSSDLKKKRTTYDHAFKLKVVRAALERPQNNRIKPTCAWFPGIEPCQLRKWIRNLEAEARPGSSAHPTFPTYMPTAAPAKAQAKPKPMRVPKASHEPDVSALASQRTPRRAAAGAVAAGAVCAVRLADGVHAAAAPLLARLPPVPLELQRRGGRPVRARPVRGA